MHPRDFVSQQHAKFLKCVKENLEDCEVVLIGNFAEKYLLILQDAVQGFPWKNQQAKIHPFVVYYKTPNYSFQHLSFVVIPDCLQHDTVSVHYFQKELIGFLKPKLAVKKIFYYSDGAAAQHKN